MITEPKRIRVSPNTEIAHLLEEAKNTPLILESGGEIYHLYREPVKEIWKEYSTQEVVSVIEKLAGAWRDLDTDKLISEIYSAREQGTRPLSRP